MSEPAEVADLPEAANVSIDRWPQSLADMLDVAASALERDGIPAEVANRQARLVMLELAEYHGGMCWYLPTGATIKRALRDDTIFRETGQFSMADIAQRHGISLQRAYQIVSQQRALRRLKPAQRP